MPEKREKTAAWCERLRAWKKGKPRRTGTVFEEPAAEEKKEAGWVEKGQQALALQRMHNLAVQQGKYLSKKLVHEEWSRRAFYVSRRLLALPRALAARVPSAVAELVEREAMAVIREVLQEYARVSDATPASAQEQPA